MKKALIDQKKCVACGCCMAACKRHAISILRGKFAVVDQDRCVGCGVCADKCPASLIVIREVNADE